MPYNGIWLMTRKMRSVSYIEDPVSLSGPPIFCGYAVLQECVAYPRPHKFLVEWYFGFRGRDLGEQRSERFDEVKESYYMAPRNQSEPICKSKTPEASGLYSGGCNSRPLMIVMAPQRGLLLRTKVAEKQTTLKWRTRLGRINGPRLGIL